MIPPPTAPHYQLNRFFNLPLVGITLLNHRYWDTVGAKHQLSSRRVRETGQSIFYLFSHSVYVEIVLIESLHAMNRHIIVIEPSPLIQTASSSRAGMLWIKR